MSKQLSSLDDKPATRKMLHHVRDELKSDILAVNHRVEGLEKKMDSQFANLDSKFAAIDARFASMDARFSSMDSKFASMDEKLEKMNAMLERMAFRTERQDFDNRSLYELYKGVTYKQDSQDVRIAEMHEILRQLATRKNQ